MKTKDLDSQGRNYVRGMNCSTCGRWVGRDGFCDISLDNDSGCWECGYPLCGQCLREEEVSNEQGV